MSLYNELRPPFSQTNPDLMQTYNWAVWYTQIRRGADAINAANPDVLIFLSGLNGDVDLQPVVDGTPLVPSDATFDAADFRGYADKLVLELHSYDIVTPVADCPSYNDGLVRAGYAAVRGAAANRFPVVLSEWGFAQDASTWRGEGSSSSKYATCVQRFLGGEFPGTGWMIWVLSGSYYIRQGNQDADESWGLLSHDFSDWRSPDFIEAGLKPLVSDTLGPALETL